MNQQPVSIFTEIGYKLQVTPAGRKIWVSPKHYPMSYEELDQHDAYAEETYEAFNAEQRAIDEDLGYGDPCDGDIDWGMDAYDNNFELED